MSVDGTVRYLIAFGDGQSVETVWMPEGDGGESGDGAEDSSPNTSGAEALTEKKGSIAAVEGLRQPKANPDQNQPQTGTSRDRIGGGRRFAFRARWDAPSTANFA